MATFTPDDVAGIVREVLRRIATPARFAPAATPASFAPAATPAHAASLAPAATPAAPLPADGFAIPERIVSAATLATVPPGTRSVRLRADAVITPSARDTAREAGYELVRSAAGNAAPAAATAFPFFLAVADAPPEALSRSTAIARAVPRVRRLPPTGLADVVKALAEDLVRDGGRGLLLTGRPHAAVALANRSSGIRAVTARDTATLLAAAAECAANLVIVAPRDFSTVALERVAVAIAGRPAGPPPGELAQACACGGPASQGSQAVPAKTGCSCTSHPH